VDSGGRSRVIERGGEAVDDVHRRAKVGEVQERQVDRSGGGAGVAECEQLAELPLLSGHSRTVPEPADRGLSPG
jgi:hypothetical protein